MSTEDYWPGEQPEVSAIEAEAVELDEDDEDTGDEDEAEEEEAEEEEAEEEEAAEEEPEEDEAFVSEAPPAGHAPGDLEIPDDVNVLAGEPRGSRRGIGIVASRFNGDITNRLLESALAELDRAGVDRELVTVMAVPGAFELPIGAMALAKSRRYACIIALGCVIRGETAHFDYIAGEAASGLQLASLETGVPVAFGVLTCDTLQQAMARTDKGAEAVRTALEMADVFSQLRATAKAAT